MGEPLPLVDYSNLFLPEKVSQSLDDQPLSVKNPYQSHIGIRYEYGEKASAGSSEVFQLGDDALLLFSERNDHAAISQQHIVGHEDWIHVQFRLEGTGEELFDDDLSIRTPSQSCMIVRHQAGTKSIRTTDSNLRSRFACLYFQPSALGQLFGITTHDLPEQAHWISESAISKLDWIHKPLPSAAAMAANDIFNCPLQGGSRSVYMRAKSMELMAFIINEIQRSDSAESSIKLSQRDLDCLSRVREILVSDFSAQHSLQDLAKQVGINRTKLAVGFKSVYGETVAAYWRDLKLAKARQLLEEEGVTVIEASNAVGYAEPSCLSRAFMARYGIQPIECRNKGRKS